MEDYEEKLIQRYINSNRNNAPPQNALPEILYHYTTQDGLLGILNDSKIWATDILYLNDETEFKYSIGLMKERIKKIVKPISGQKAKKFLKHLLEPPKHLNEFQIFVCSFSIDGKSLSQFRSYCPENNGFSIGFDYSQLNNVTKNQNFRTYLLPCFYEKSMIAELANETIDGIVSFLKTEVDDDLNKAIGEYDSEFPILASILKHESFHDEREWRLFIFKKRPVASSEIQFRKGKSMLLPYITVDLQGTTKLPPIKQIYVGPTPHQDLSTNSVKLLVQSKHLSCSVEHSGIPYRSW
jgi:hypothetical protein